MTKFNVKDIILSKEEIDMPEQPNIPKGVNGIIKEVKITTTEVEYLIDFDCVINNTDYNDITVFESEDKITER